MSEGHNGSNWVTETLSNRPFIVGALFLGTYFVPFLILIGLALAYAFRAKPEEDWESSHFQYLIRTFWIGLLGAILTVFLVILSFFIADQSGLDIDGENSIVTLVFTLFVVMVPLLALCGVRIVLSLMKSAAHKPMPKPKSWTV